jgi:hypothetical protein
MNKKVNSAVFIPFVLSIVFFAFTIYYFETLPFKEIDSTLVWIGILDYLLTISVAFIFFWLNKNKIEKFSILLQVKYKKIVESSYILFIVIAVYVLNKTYSNMSLILIQGINREGLFKKVSSNYLDMMLPILLASLLIVAFLYKYSLKTKIILFITVIAVMLQYLSRSDLLFLIIFAITMFILGNIKLNFKKITLFVLVSFILVFAASAVTVLQGREHSIGTSLSKISVTLFRFRAYSFPLAQIALDASQGIEKAFFPFLGFASEKVISTFEYIDYPISVLNSNFVSSFHYLGGGFHGNVLYPWWAWFYGYFGLFGIFLKTIYIYFLLTLLLRFKMVLTFSYFFYAVLFTIEIRHPLLNASNFYSFLGIVIFDVLAKFKFTLKLKESNKLYSYEQHSYS